MKIRITQGVAGCWKGKDFQYPRGYVGEFENSLAKDLIKGGNATEVLDEPIREVEAITPIINRVKTTVIKKKNV